MNEGKISRVKLKDVEKNPFRQFSIYAIQEAKVNRLINSINDTGFWETVIGRRRKDGKVEIAFGHHRIEAAKRVYKKPDDTIPIIIRNLSDDQMRKMMIDENAEEYGCVPAAIDDAVKAAKDFLEENPDAAREVLSSDRPEVKRVRIGAPAIAKYSGFPQSTVEISLNRLGMIERGEIDAEAVYLMPNQAAAKRFVKAVIGHPRSKSHQKTLAKRIVDEGRYGEASIEQAFTEFVPLVKKTDPYNPGYFELKMAKAVKQGKGLINTLSTFRRLNPNTFFGGEKTAEDIAQKTREKYRLMINELAEMIEMVAKKLDEEPKKGWLDDES